MKKLQKILAILMGFVLVLSFSISCAAETEPEEVIEEETESVIETEPEAVKEPVEEEAIETVVEEGKIAETKTIETDKSIEEETYIAETLILGIRTTSNTKKFAEAMEALVNNEISITEHKMIAEEYIEEIKSCYDTFLDLKPGERFEKSYELKGKAWDYLLNSATYMQKYVDTDNIDKMKEYLGKATDEASLAAEYINKATSQVEEELTGNR